MKLTQILIVVACVALLVGCASVPPPELINARQAYQHASSGEAAQLVPAELHKAEVALAIAEKAFQDDPKSFHTRDLAYVADRKAKMAEALATTAAGNAATAKANKDYQATQTEIVKNTKDDLAASERSSALKTEQIAAEQKAGVDAETRRVKQQADADAQALRVKDSTDAVARNVKDSNDAEARRVKDLADAEARRLAEQKGRDTTIIVLERGKKVVLKGINFEFNKATLRKDSETILTMAYNAMVANPDVQVEISGHTDNVGSQESNQVLSLKRAQAVRNWLVEKGIASNRMKAVGKGQNEPVATNDTDTGRAENRRIEFYVQQ
jgi:outer membrane protein OmpA-like peptidoglycan-associated protein